LPFREDFCVLRELPSFRNLRKPLEFLAVSNLLEALLESRFKYACDFGIVQASSADFHVFPNRITLHHETGIFRAGNDPQGPARCVLPQFEREIRDSKY